MHKEQRLSVRAQQTAENSKREQKQKRQKKIKNKTKKNNSLLGIFGQDRLRVRKKFGHDEKDEASSPNSNLVVCIKSSFPNHLTNIDSHVLDQMQSCCNECPCVDCKTCRFDLRRIE